MEFVGQFLVSPVVFLPALLTTKEQIDSPTISVCATLSGKKLQQSL